MMRTAIARIAAAAAVTIPLVALPVADASAANCSTKRIEDGYGHAEVYHCGSYVTGDVFDDKADGKCVYYWVVFHKPDGSQERKESESACPKGTSKGFYLDGGAGAWRGTEGIGKR